MGQSKGSKKSKSKSKGRNKRKFNCCHECGKIGMGVRSREASVFEASKRSLAEARCVDLVNVDLNSAGDWSSVVAREKSQDSGWNRFVYCQ